jgi:hypothetical protein
MYPDRCAFIETMATLLGWFWIEKLKVRGCENTPKPSTRFLFSMVYLLLGRSFVPLGVDGGIGRMISILAAISHFSFKD